MEQANKKEIRMLEMRAVEDSEKMVIEGYAVVFDSPATHYWTESIDKNAFNGCDMKDVCLRYNHNDNTLVLAKTRNRSLQLTVDDKGLKIRAELIDTTSNKDIYKSIQAGLLDKMSFAFTCTEEKWDYETDPSTRTILKIDKLYDVSVVDVPFYDTTEVFARSLEEVKEEQRKHEAFKLEKSKLIAILDL